MAGRPSKYKPEYADRVTALCRLGATFEDLGQIFEVSPSTVRKWPRLHHDFGRAMEAGRIESDANVANALYTSAMDGNVTAMIFWLKNRRKDEWRDRHEYTAKVEHAINRTCTLSDGEPYAAVSAAVPETSLN